MSKKEKKETLPRGAGSTENMLERWCYHVEILIQRFGPVVNENKGGEGLSKAPSFDFIRGNMNNNNRADLLASLHSQ